MMRRSALPAYVSVYRVRGFRVLEDGLVTPTTTNLTRKFLSLSEAADRWRDVYAEKQANDNLRDLEKNFWA
jgi:hypothetical protein